MVSQVGMYFAWLGFYTQMLILPSIFGIITMLIGALNAVFLSEVTIDYCYDEYVKNVTICRACSSVACPFKRVLEKLINWITAMYI